MMIYEKWKIGKWALRTNISVHFAFEDIEHLETIIIPGSATGVGVNAFTDCRPKLISKITEGSTIQRFSEEYGIR